MITENIVLTQDFSWTDIENPLKPDFDFIEEEFNLPPLFIQDCLSPEQLPKFERTQNGFFFMIRLYDLSSLPGEITIQRLTNKLAIFISDGSVVTIHNDLIVPLKKFTDMRKSPGFPEGPKKLIHQLMRISVLSFDDALARLQESYEEFEKEILSKEAGRLSNTRVYEFRRKLFVVQGIMQLMQQALYNSRDFWEDETILQHDIKENIDQLYFRLQGLAHNFDQLFALYLSINEQRNNDVVKILTVFASILLPLTFIASFYGMNFDNLPGIHTTTGLVGALLIMSTTTFITVWFFNKKKWFKSSV